MRRNLPGNELSISDARLIIDRQKTQINSQLMMINQREQEIQRLKILNNQKINLKNRCNTSDLSIDEEVKLQQLRGLRGQTEKLRLNNEVILNEINSVKGHLSNKSTDLASYLRSYHQYEEQIRLAMSWREWLDECLKIVVNINNNTASIQERSRLANIYQDIATRPPLQFLSQEQWRTWNETLKKIKTTDENIMTKRNSSREITPNRPKADLLNTFQQNYKPLPILLKKDTKTDVELLHTTNELFSDKPRPSSRNDSPDNHSKLLTATTSSNKSIQPTAVSGLFTRATNSPPSARRASLMLLLSSAASTPSVTPTGEPNKVFQVSSGSKGLISRKKCPEATIFALGRAKTPPRYASRTVINDTYMRRLLDKENIEKYKKTANEIYMNQVAKISSKAFIDSAKQTSSQCDSSLEIRCKEKEDKCNIVNNNNIAVMEKLEISHHSESSESSSNSSLDMVGLSEKDAIEVDLDKRDTKDQYLNEGKSFETGRVSLDLKKGPIPEGGNLTTQLDQKNDGGGGSTNNSADSAVIVDMSTSSSVNSPNMNTPLIPPLSNGKGRNGSSQNDTTIDLMDTVLHDLKINSSTTLNSVGNVSSRSLNIDDSTKGQSMTSFNSNNSSPSAINLNGPSSDESLNIEIYVPPIDKKKVVPILKRSNLKKDLTENEIKTLHDEADAKGQDYNIVRFHPLALLLDAALEGDIELVKRAHKQVEDVSLPNDEGITALHNAVCAGRIEIAKYLVLEAGADVNSGDTDGWTPLHCAASCANLKLARLLVENGAVLNARTLSDYETPLEKCDNGACEDVDCEDYLYMEHERLFSSKNHTVYAVFDRLKPPTSDPSAASGEDDVISQNMREPEEVEEFHSDELEISVNDELLVLDPNPPDEPDWMLVRNVLTSKEGLVPKNFISCYRVKRKIILDEKLEDKKNNIPAFKPEISDLLLLDSTDDQNNLCGRDEVSSQSSTAQNTVQHCQNSESPLMIPFSSLSSSNRVDEKKKADPVVIQTAM